MDRNEKIWAAANTGTKVHGYVQISDIITGGGFKRALCRKTTLREVGARFVRLDQVPFGVCTRCRKLAEAMWARAEASMQPATEAHDLGYAEPVGNQTGDVIEEAHAEALTEDGEQTAEAVLAWLSETSTSDMDAPHAEDRVADKVKARITGRKPLDMDALHAEALAEDLSRTLRELVKIHGAAAVDRTLEQVSDENEPPARWYYRARRVTRPGEFLGVVEGYVTAPDASTAEKRVRAEREAPAHLLTDFFISRT